MQLEGKKIAVFPYNYEFVSLLRSDVFKNVGFELFSPKAWSLCGKDASYADGGRPIGNNVRWLSGSESLSCDVLIIPDCQMDNQVLMRTIRLAREFINCDKSVVCMYHDAMSLPEDIRKKRNFLSYNSLAKPLINIDRSEQKNILCEIDTPIVLICGLMPDLNKFDIQLMTVSALKNLGCKVSWIGSKQYMNLLGFHSFSEYSIYSSGKFDVLAFNRYISDIERLEQPDVIVIGIPGGVMAYSQIITNDFGIESYCVFNAIQPDYVMLCLPNTDVKSEYLNMLSAIFRYRFNSKINTFCISNRNIDSKPYIKGNGCNPVVYDYRYMDNKYKRVREDCNGFDILKVWDMDLNKMIKDRMSMFLEESSNGL